MAKTALVDADVEAGERLYKAIHEDGLVALAGWLRRQDENEFKLWLAIPSVEMIGPFEVYSQIKIILEREKITGLSISDIIISNARIGLVTAIASAFHVESARIRFTRCTFGDELVEDLILYKADREVIARSIAEFSANQNSPSGKMNRKQRRAAAARRQGARKRA